MKTTNEIRHFVTDSEILEVLELADNKRMIDAARMLMAYMFPKWQLTTLEAVAIVEKLKEEWKIK